MSAQTADLVTDQEPMQLRGPFKMPEWKRLWQQRDRDAFKHKHGFSKTTAYRFGGNRMQALERDEFKCVKCGMSDETHRERWGRPITVDHKDRNQKNNDLKNLQTLCLSCHGRKDISPRLKTQKRKISAAIMVKLRQSGKTFKQIGIQAGIDGSLCRKIILNHLCKQQ